ncbi:hypothetical protein OWM54_41790 [Myxococcus sp. MISCRS1]|uniref:Uncharacterized protein n=1 Tax=Myxococcus fulvus TaxID=33 RepID=A0A511TEB8_MYXFU|nr:MULTISPECIES: hypothetical protein [Myxococcus]AKF81698.1 hypothetical protein MFUL124B02_22480 [Myxococcus fulvus 124B02]BDT34693.1 hypothetical protein MFMH1_43620 [Myxococcus sp. MH1]MBZ4411084.1 hypothetical protein [Myxococcus sp. XM-1-1-1]MCY1003696.1 hypothetical protein [Myxococcus sp. MISCRS1]SET86353.1 hypothetical protein SAMN05443572_103560 [Myxococcus fulvus]
MDTARLEGLGLQVREDVAGTEAVLDLESSPLVNPVTKAFIAEVTFQVMGDRLIPISPAAVVGLAPILIGALSDVADIEALLSDAFNEHIFHVQRRSAELQVLGLSPRVDADTLELTTDVVEGDLSVLLAADRLGNFRIARVQRDKVDVAGGAGHTLELSEFRERAALTGYLAALLGEPASRPQPTPTGLVRFSDIVEKFGAESLVPPRSSLELLAQLQVEGRPYRFAAARVAGRTFRGLLAGAQGKVWAGRFELDEFPGIVRMVASLLKVRPEAVRLVGPDAPQE